MILITNKRAHYDYQIFDQITAGIILTGPEVKSLRLKHASLTGSFVRIVGKSVVLLNAQISPYKFAANQDYDPKRTRQLLLQQKEIYRLADQVKQKNYTLVPLNFSLVGKKIKLTVGLGRGKKQFEKKQALKKRDLERESKFTT
jgi:SsrA-binding protein